MCREREGSERKKISRLKCRFEMRCIFLEIISKNRSDWSSESIDRGGEERDPLIEIYVYVLERIYTIMVIDYNYILLLILRHA